MRIWQYARASAPSNAAEIGVIGGADGPTAIITAYNPTNSLSLFLQVGVPLLLLIVCVVLAVNVWRLEKRLK